MSIYIHTCIHGSAFKTITSNKLMEMFQHRNTATNIPVPGVTTGPKPYRPYVLVAIHVHIILVDSKPSWAQEYQTCFIWAECVGCAFKGANLLSKLSKRCYVNIVQQIYYRIVKVWATQYQVNGYAGQTIQPTRPCINWITPDINNSPAAKVIQIVIRPAVNMAMNKIDI